MRTTIELTSDLRARVLALAARRGERGFSRIVAEALERFLSAPEDTDRERRIAKALAAFGSLDARSAARLRRVTRATRRRWRA